MIKAKRAYRRKTQDLSCIDVEHNGKQYSVLLNKGKPTGGVLCDEIPAQILDSGLFNTLRRLAIIQYQRNMLAGE